MEITYSKKGESMYIKLNDRRVAQTRPITELVNLDFDSDDQIIGIELLYVPNQVDNPFEVLFKYLPPDMLLKNQNLQATPST